MAGGNLLGFFLRGFFPGHACRPRADRACGPRSKFSHSPTAVRPRQSGRNDNHAQGNRLLLTFSFCPHSYRWRAASRCATDRCKVRREADSKGGALGGCGFDRASGDARRTVQERRGIFRARGTGDGRSERHHRLHHRAVERCTAIADGDRPERRADRGRGVQLDHAAGRAVEGAAAGAGRRSDGGRFL